MYCVMLKKRGEGKKVQKISVSDFFEMLCNETATNWVVQNKKKEEEHAKEKKRKRNEQQNKRRAKEREKKRNESEQGGAQGHFRLNRDVFLAHILPYVE